MQRTNVNLHLSSFGPFLNVVDNPSTRIARRVVELCEEHQKTRSSSSSGQRLPFTVADFTVLEVSIDGVGKYFAALERSLLLADGSTTNAIPQSQSTTTEAAKEADTTVSAGQEMPPCYELLIHLGVYRGLKDSIRLEQTAFNEAHFPQGDFNGVVLHHAQIDRSMATDTSRRTGLPLAELLHQARSELQNEGGEIGKCFASPAALECFQLTDDPGRYLCNYCFFNSSLLSSRVREQSATVAGPDSRRRCESLFIHVADGDGPLSIEDQSQAIFSFLTALALLLQSDTHVKQLPTNSVPLVTA